MKKVYLDYAASTPTRKEVLKEIQLCLLKKFGNPSSLHSFGRDAFFAINIARKKIAEALNADSSEIIFTSGATEANNLALKGVLRAYTSQKRNLKNPKIIVSNIEHESVLEVANELKKDGVEVVYLPVDKKGVFDLKKLEKLLDENVILVSLMYVNNEIGTLEPIEKVAKIIQYLKKERGNYPIFHSDAAQALMYFDCDAKKLGIDLMTISGQKIFATKGIGALYIKKEVLLKKMICPLIQGGFQESGLRGGTENTSLITGFGKAVELAKKERKKNFKYVQTLKIYFWKNLKKIYPRSFINGLSSAPHILNICIPFYNSFELLTKLDMCGVAASYGSACQSRFYEPSYVLQALGLEEKFVKSSLRFSFGITTTKKELDFVLSVMKKIKNAQGA